MTVANTRRRLSAGVELQGDGTAHARVWAPACRSVEFVRVGETGNTIVALDAEPDGFFGAPVPDVKAGDRYWFRLDGERLRPDPRSRYQPEGPHGPSAVVDPESFRWTDAAWRGISAEGHVIYELHVGTFTPEGTWSAAAAQLEELARLGITVIEMMPLAEFPGRWGWGYDGVNMFAPTRLYGTPDDLRAFVDRAHALGLAIILDVVYNHFGPDGNYLAEFSPDFFTRAYENEWGDAINFEGPRQVREYFTDNAAYWISEFHFDGLRLDATQDIHDRSEEHILAAVTRSARAAAGARQIYIIAENERQQTRFARPLEHGGLGIDALWNDDFHHSAAVALTGRREAYFTDYLGAPQEFVSCAKYGYLYQGQWYVWQKQRRGTPALDLPHSAFVSYIENHDQVANTGVGRRLHQVTSPALYRAMTAALLLGPATPLLFQGEEFASSAPFAYFVDHEEALRRAVSAGRRAFLGQFPSLRDPALDPLLPSPEDEATFYRCKLDLSERQRHTEAYALHRDLIQLRHSDPVLARIARVHVDGAVLGERAFVLRYFGESDGDRLLVVNLGIAVDLTPMPEPLLAPPPDARWVLQWSSEAPAYGGFGVAAIDPNGIWKLPAGAAMFFRSERRAEADAAEKRTDRGE